jgi:cytochrome P450
VTSALDQGLGALLTSDPAALDDPFPLLNELRERAPVYEFDGTYLVSRYEDVRRAMAIKDHSLHRDQLRSRNADEALAKLTDEEQEAWASFWNSWGATLTIAVDAPHERLRRIAHRGFTPARIAAVTQSIRSYADELLDELGAQGDVVDLTAYAQKLTLRVIISVLGTPQEDGPLVLRWVERAGANFGNIGRKDIDTAVLLDACAANREFCQYIEGFLVESRAGRVEGSELADTLLDAEQDERMTTDELVAMFMLLLSAGHDTTKNLVAIGTLELMRHRDQWERLCGDPGVLATGVDELIRWVSPLLISFRLGIVDREVEYDGVTIPPDTVIMPVVGARIATPTSSPTRTSSTWAAETPATISGSASARTSASGPPSRGSRDRSPSSACRRGSPTSSWPARSATAARSLFAG